jgi:hypothetical protein
MNGEIRFNNAIVLACDASSHDDASTRAAVLLAFLEYAQAWLQLIPRQTLDGSPMVSGLMIYKTKGWGYAVTIEHPNAFLRYPLAPDGTIRRVDLERDPPPQSFVSVTAEDLRDPPVTVLLEATAKTLTPALPEATAVLQRAAKKLSGRHPHLGVVA